jgi:hypothetical protein
MIVNNGLTVTYGNPRPCAHVLRDGEWIEEPQRATVLEISNWLIKWWDEHLQEFLE